MAPALRTPDRRIPPRRRLGVRLWLSLAFAGVGIVTGASVYAFVSGSSEESAQERSVEISVGRTVRVADSLGAQKRGATDGVLEENRSEDFVGWAFNRKGALITPPAVLGIHLGGVRAHKSAVNSAL